MIQMDLEDLLHYLIPRSVANILSHESFSPADAAWIGTVRAPPWSNHRNAVARLSATGRNNNNNNNNSVLHIIHIYIHVYAIYICTFSMCHIVLYCMVLYSNTILYHIKLNSYCMIVYHIIPYHIVSFFIYTVYVCGGRIVTRERERKKERKKERKIDLCKFCRQLPCHFPHFRMFSIQKFHGSSHCIATL